MTLTLPEIAYLTGVLLSMVVRTVYGVRYRRMEQEATAASNREPLLVAFFMALWGVAMVVAIVEVLSGWLDFADYRLPRWAGWVGIVFYGAGVWLLYRSHADLEGQWSPSLELRGDHHLVTSGVFRHMRHPMYGAHLLLATGQALLVQNWIAGPLALVAFAGIYALRVPYEEGMMLDRFGDEYRAYMAHTGRLFPRF